MRRLRNIGDILGGHSSSEAVCIQDIGVCFGSYALGGLSARQLDLYPEDWHRFGLLEAHDGKKAGSYRDAVSKAWRKPREGNQCHAYRKIQAAACGHP